MGYVNINFTQSALNTAEGASVGFQGQSFQELANAFNLLNQQFTSSHTVSSSVSIASNSAHLSYADGAYIDYTGVVFADPNAMSGTAYATQVNSVWPSAFSTNVFGHLNYQYSLNGGVAQLAPTGGTIYGATVKSLLQPGSPLYQADVGNQDLSLSGTVTVDTNGNFSGPVSHLEAHADRFLTDANLWGEFYITGNVYGRSATTIGGVASRYTQVYADGSGININQVAMPVSGSTVFDKQWLANAAYWSGADEMNITLPAQLPTPWLIASGAGSDKLTIKGGGSGLTVDAGSDNDTITLADHGHRIVGGDGSDTVVMNGAQSAFTVTRSGDTLTVRVNDTGAIDTLTGVERLKFTDGLVAMDINGIGGEAYRLYQAAFNRVPDKSGLGFWIAYMDHGMTLNEAAQQFMASPEFKNMYGTNPTNADFVDKLYHNVLHRAGEPDGVKFWMDYLTTGGGTQAKVLAFFDESPENQAALIGTIGNGFSYLPYGS